MLKTEKVIEIKDLKVYNPRVKENIKLTTLGDLHISPLVSERKLEPVINQIEKEEADYNIFLGDLIDSPKDLDNADSRRLLTNTIKRSATIAPTIVILGSHDFVLESKSGNAVVANGEFWQELDDIKDVHILLDRTYQDEKMFFMGYVQTLKYYYNNIEKTHIEDLEAFYEDMVTKENLYKNLPKDVPTVGLIHSPEFAKDEKNVELMKEYNLLLGGHNHDGCVPFGLFNTKRGLISPKKELFPKDVRGVRTLSSGTDLLISGGIVKMGNSCPKIMQPLNYLCPMQMETVELTNDETYKDNISVSKRLVRTR